MEEGIGKGDLQGNGVRLSSLRPSGNFKPTLSGKSSPRNSPSFRRLHSGRTPRREARGSGGGGVSQWFRSNRIVYWLLLITLWAYLGFYVQSRWAHGDNKEDIFAFGNKPSHEISEPGQTQRRDLIADEKSLVVTNETKKNNVGAGKIIDVVLAKKRDGVASRKKLSVKKRSKKAQRSLRGKQRGKQKPIVDVEGSEMDEQEPDIPKQNTTYGLLVGPFGSTEDKILDWSPVKRSGTCERKGAFARVVWSRKFVLIFHELSLTGAPLSMLELASELLSCGASVTAIVLSKKGGLMAELSRRKINVLEDKAEQSFKFSKKADLIIAGSAVCASWIEQYMARWTTGSSKIAWWIMENRREYFNRSKLVLDQVRMLIFISESQSKQWQSWCEEENIKLMTKPTLIPLSVNDELAFVAGIACSLNTPSFSTEKMLEKRNLLRDAVRKEMGLTDNDMLLVSLSSINPGKGQLLLLESARLLIEQKLSLDDLEIKNLVKIGEDQPSLTRKHHIRALLQNENHVSVSSNGLDHSNESSNGLFTSIDGPHAVNVGSRQERRKMLSAAGGTQKQDFKVLIGSVGSKSNKIPYVKGILSFLSQHSNLSKSVLWTPATTRVAALYSAADAYIINAQGLGETFGRVTIEAMAFGLPILGTDAGGTKEIVEQNVTGLLHPVGHPGTQILAQNIRLLLQNASAREQMGMKGRKKVEKMYLKRHMYKRFADVLFSCMRIK